MSTIEMDSRLNRIRQLEDEHGFGLVGTYLLDYQKKIVYADKTLSAMYGLPFDEAGIPLADFLKNIDEEDLQRANHLREAQINKSEPYQIEYRVRISPEKTKWVLARAKAKMVDGDLFYEGIVVDVTSGKEADIALQTQNKLIRTITDNATSALFLMNDKGYCTFMNPAAETMFGYTLTEIKSKPLHYLIHHHYPDGREYPMEECPLDRALPQNFEMRAHEDLFFRKDGTSLPVLCAASPIFENGIPVATVIEVRDISEQKKANMLLQTHAERLEILNSIGLSISESLDLQEILQKVTDAVTKLTGANFGAFFYNTINASGEAFLLYTLSGAPREAFEKFGTPRNTAVFHPTFAGEGVVRVADITKDPRYGKNAPNNGMPAGHLPVVSYLAVPVISKSGKVIGGLFLGHKDADVFTAEHESLVLGVASQAAIALDNAKLYEEVKELSIKKDEFLSIASHELKTPLTSIKAFNQLMQRTKDCAKLSDFVQKSAEHISRLEKLINDLLDVSKINAGKLQFTMEQFNFRQIVTDCVESVQHLAPSHKISVENAVDVLYTGDRLRLEQVLNNFLTNAVKYSPGGERVLVSSTLQSNNLIVSVQDFGIGIPQDQLDKLFDRYYRVDNTSMRFEGLGLGLFISSEILKRHGGDFWIESEQGKGSTFFFRLPLERQGEAEVTETEISYKDSSITILYNQQDDRIEVDWKGFQNFSSVQNGCMKMLEILKKNQCYKVINDNRNIQGTWSEAAEWVGREWFPMMEEAGLRYFAWIFSPSTFSQLSAKKSVDIKEGRVMTEFFTDIGSAEKWLDDKGG
ncbi:ATP-binding protein [Desertivirga brevis]|uniref:ATP-binding protein n=1 Tax=Desertivirga brevis TaxID=2810310 RepID=UPI001A958784|nr:ATP-binding protein [Pedobacter sp. SYSU D00873]